MFNLIKIFIVLLFSLLIAFLYYAFPSHIENFDGYFSYIIIIFLVWSVYKYFSVSTGDKKVEFSLVSILGYFLLHLAILSALFFSYNGESIGNFFVLFFKIILFSIIPTLIVVLSISFGKKIVDIFFKELYKIDTENKTFTFLVSLGLGFFSFVSLLIIFAYFGLLNLYTVSFILICFSIFSYKEIGVLFNDFINYKIEFENHDLDSTSFVQNLAPKLISTEFLFIVASLIISINLINIVRPMPIGWDDLGVYMNYPRQIAYAGDLLSLGSMYAWQVFTSIGFMIAEPVQAFFLNNVGGILSFIVLILIVSDLLKDKLKHTFINIPLLIATIFISMPMVIFQQAKDMKLDEGLFFISIIPVYIIFKIFTKQDAPKNIFSKILPKFLSKNKFDDYKNNANYVQILDNNDFLSDKKLTYKILFIIGLLAGFAFSIKFTSLLLISAIIGVLFYTEIGFAGFLGFLAIFFAVFTKADLWKYMNVVYDKTNIDLANSFSISSFILGFIFLLVGFLRHKKDVQKLLINLSIFIAGILIALSPWLAKNIYEARDNISVGTILNGKPSTFKIDLDKIHTKEVQQRILEQKTKMSTGTTTNEDLGRYVGYEGGINNYIKFPWSLTMQTNQGGEFTTIGWLFLALIPGLFLFLPYRKKGLEFGIVFVLVLELALYIIPVSRECITGILSSISVPEGYLYILLFFLIPFIYLLFSLEKNKLNNLFKVNLVFAIFYIFLWTISAFGIVWYGIVMYFSLLMMIAIPLVYISTYENKNDKKYFVQFISSFSIFIIFLIWIFASVFPHSFNNLKNASYNPYKSGQYGASELIFLYHNDYLKMIFSMNIDKNKQIAFLEDSIKDEQLKTLAKPYFNDIYILNQYLNIISSGDFTKIFSRDQINQIGRINLQKLQLEARKSKDNIYAGILKPSEKYKSKAGIYRVGTFLKYFIDNNQTRLLEDSLLDFFDDYIYDKDYNLITDRFKKLGISYLLVDLNAATIDKDPRHDLTKRYENMLISFTNDNLKLVESDSMCLKFALEKYKTSPKTIEDLNEYKKIAGGNYESYTDKDEVINRWKKQIYCYEKIIETINSGKVNNSNYTYLIPVANFLIQNNKEYNNADNIFGYMAKAIPQGARVLFEIK